MMPLVLSLVVLRIRTPWMMMLLTFSIFRIPAAPVPPVKVIPGEGALKPSMVVFEGILNVPEIVPPTSNTTWFPEEEIADAKEPEPLLLVLVTWTTLLPPVAPAPYPSKVGAGVLLSVTVAEACLLVSATLVAVTV